MHLGRNTCYLMEKKKLRIRTELYTGNKTLIPDGFYCVNFYNQGTDTAVIMGTITVTPGTSHEFNFERDEVIDTKFDVLFRNETTDHQLVVTTIYAD